jgi:hypothetical protein
MAITTSSELFINMKDVPIYDKNKHYFDQSKDVRDFHQEERNKLIRGLNIGGFRIHPWLYWHINFFKTPIPIEDEGVKIEKVMVPPLDDNILYITDTYQQAEKENKGMCVFGTRGFSKSTLIASLCTHLVTIRENGSVMVIGGGSEDLGAISGFMETALERVDSAFYMPRLLTDWNRMVEFGVRKKSGTKHIFSRFDIRNADDSKEKSTEKGAGLNPVGFVADEIGKWNPIKILESAIPSFMTPMGAKLVHTLMGTGGNTVLSNDAKIIMQNPADFNLLMLNRDRLDRSVPEEALTWKDTKDKEFCTFVPGQMSYRLGILKKVTTLAKHLGKESKELDKIQIKVTDWVAATRMIEEKRSTLKKESSTNKHKMYYPLRTSDCFLVDAVNPFPTTVISNHIEKLEAEGRTGKNVMLYREGNSYKYEFSNKPRAKVSHDGGSVDSPTIIFDDPPEIIPQKLVFVGGHDGYKTDVSQTDSLGSHYIIKRRNMAPNEPCERVIASYTTRPERMIDYLKGCETMMKAWNAVTNMESVDIGLQLHLEAKKIEYDYLCPSFSFTQKTSRTRPGNSKFGLYPNTGNNTYRWNSLVAWAWEEHTIGIDNDNNPIIKYSVEFIEDVDLLREMLEWKKGNNVDRMTAFSHALVYAQELDKDNVMPEREKKPQMSKEELEKRKDLIKNSRYGNTSASRYGTSGSNRY